MTLTIDSSVPTYQVTFKSLKRNYPALNDGDLLITNIKNAWGMIYNPVGKGIYNGYTIGFSSVQDPNDLFSLEKQIKEPTIIKPVDFKIIEFIQSQLDNLFKPNRTPVFSFSTDNCSKFVNSLKNSLFSVDFGKGMEEQSAGNGSGKDMSQLD